MAAGVQNIERGIHKGLVKIISIKTQKLRPISRNKTLDYKKISSINIIVKSMNLRRNFAVFRSLEKN